MEVIAPGVPRVAARSSIELVFDTFGIEELQGGQTVLVGDVLRITLSEDQLTHVLLDAIGSLGQTLTVTLELFCLSREPASTQYPEIVELIVVVKDGLHRLHTTHRETRHRTVGLVSQHAVVVLDIGDDASNEILLKEGYLVHEVFRGDRAIGHHDNHWLHLSISQEV